MSLSVHSSNGVRETSSFTYFVYRTPLGRITLASDGEALTQMAFGVAEFKGEYRPCALTNQASSEVLEYLARKRETFTLPLHPKGSTFQKKGLGLRIVYTVWTNKNVCSSRNRYRNS